MAEALLTLNGLGLGHLVRSTLIGRWLRRAGRRPVMFFQGKYPTGLSRRLPGIEVTPLYRLVPATAQLVAEELARYVSLSEPSVIIEDTYPAAVRWPIHVKSIVTVRPTEFEYMRLLNRRHGERCRQFIVCDDPDSPVWPYNEAETSELLSWPKWRCIGPIFRRASRRGLEEVRSRYSIEDNEQVFVFSMGGGGERDGSGDRINFLRKATELAKRIQRNFPRPRMLFVCGPLFPQNLGIPGPLEVVREEPELPSLFQLATGAVIRPGFNSMWECIAGATPFLPVLGTTYLEPVRSRLASMSRYGFQIPESIENWLDSGWLENYRRTCLQAATRHSGTPAAEFVGAVEQACGEETLHAPTIHNHQPTIAGDRGEWEELSSQLASLTGAKQLLIRMDDVVRPSKALDWLLAVCRRSRLAVSLEIIPYLSRLTLKELDAIDPEGLCEVSQHGYAHLPQRPPGSRQRGEFLNESVARSETSSLLLRRGKRLLTKIFGERFRGGYSAPYDGLPAWLPNFWKSTGGEYVSWIWNSPASDSIDQVRLRLDPWDWTSGKPKSCRTMAATAISSLRSSGSIGIVLHPIHLQVRSYRVTMESLINALIDGGCTSQRVSDAAR